MDSIKKYKSVENLCFLTTFLIGFATHLFGFVNVIHNYDDISNIPAGSGTGIASGRWMLSILDKIFSRIGITYNLPYINAILFLLLLALSAKYIVNVLEIKNYRSAILFGAVFVTFPTVTSTLFFKYTVILYGIAVLCAVMAVWVIKKFKYGFIVSAFLIACSLGIYQAYVPITIALMIILLLKDVLTENSEAVDIIKQGLKYVGALVLGIIAYYAALKILLAVFHKQLGTYKGIDQMGAIEIAQLPGLLKRTFFEFTSIVFEDYKGVSQTPLIRLGILLLGCICIGLMIFILRVYRKKWNSVILCILLCAVFPIAVNFIVIMCPNSNIYTMMVYSFAMIFVVPFMLLELLESIRISTAVFTACRKYIKKAVLFGTLIVCVSYVYLANLNYTQLYYTTKKTENYMSSVVLQARMTEGFDTSFKWAFIGEDFEDPLFYNNWAGVPRYGGNAPATNLINSYSRMSWIKNYFGYDISLVEEEELAELEKDISVTAMPCFPNDGSVQIINDVVVIKLQNIE